MNKETAQEIVELMDSIGYYEEKLDILKTAREQDETYVVLKYPNPVQQHETLQEFLPITSSIISLVEHYYQDKVKKFEQELEKY